MHASEQPTQQRENDAVSGTITKHPENPFEPPKAEVGVIESEFWSSVWSRAVVGWFYGFLGALPLFIAWESIEYMPTLALAFFAVGSVCWLIAVGYVFEIWARRGVMIRARREGVLIRLTKRSEPLGIAVPGRLRIAWDLANGRGARLPVAAVPWEKIAAIGVMVLKLRLALVVQVIPDPAKGEPFIIFVRQSELAASVWRVAESLNTFLNHPDRRAALSAWDNANAGQGPIPFNES